MHKLQRELTSKDIKIVIILYIFKRVENKHEHNEEKMNNVKKRHKQKF